MGYNRGANKMDIKVFLISMVLGGEVVSLYCSDPTQILCNIAKEGVRCEGVTITKV